MALAEVWVECMIGDVELAKELIPIRYILIIQLVSQFKVLQLVQHLSDIQK